jgi:hypothetical protein
VRLVNLIRLAIAGLILLVAACAIVRVYPTLRMHAVDKDRELKVIERELKK